MLSCHWTMRYLTVSGGPAARVPGGAVEHVEAAEVRHQAGEQRLVGIDLWCGGGPGAGWPRRS